MKNLETLVNLKRYRIFWWPLAIILLIIISSLLLIKPRVSQILTLQKKYTQEKKRLAAVTQKAYFLESLDQVELAVKTKQVLAVLPPEIDVTEVLLVLKTLGQEKALNFYKINVDPGGLSSASAQKKNSRWILPSLSLSIGVNGEKENLYLFLEEIEKTLPIMRVEKISLTPHNNVFSELEFTLQALFSPLPEKLGKLEEPISNLTSQEEDTYQRIQNLNSVLSETAFTEDLPAGKENLFSF